MSDVRKTVEIALQVVGVDLKKIAEVSKAFESVQKSIENTTKYVSNFQKSLSTLKAPSSLTQVIDTLKQLDKVKAPNLSNIANGFDKLGKMKAPPDISAFVTELRKFSGIKLPGLNTLVNGFKRLVDLPVHAIVVKIRSLNTALAELDKRGGIRAFKNFASDVSTLKSAFSTAATATQNMSNQLRQVGNAAQDSGLKLRTFADKVRTVVQFRLISGALLAVKDAVNAGVSAIVEYDQALKDLQAITGATTLEVAQMGMKILEVASTTKFSAQEIAQGMRVIGQAGFNASDAVETMQAVSDLATGTLSDMSTTVDLVTTAMRVFQIDATESANVADVFANAVNRSKLTIDKLRTAMNYIGPIARDSGVSFKELSASMMTLANSGLRASTIGTGLRRVFAELIDPSKKLRAAARNAGVALSELDPRASSLSEVIANLGLVVNDAQVAFDVFGKRGAAAVLALSGTDSKFREMLTTVDRSGVAAQQAAIQMEGLGVSFKNLKDKLGILAIAFGELGISDAMRILVDVSRTLIDVITVLINSALARFIAKSALFTVAVYGIIKALTALHLFIKLRIFTVIAAGIAEASSAALFFGTTMSGLLAILAPFVLIIGAISAAIYGLYSVMSDGAIKASKNASLLADKYDILEKKIRDYGKTTINMKKGSKELAEANLELRRRLLEVSKGNSELADSALKAAESINPLNGEFVKGKEALEAYNAELNKFQTEELLKALQLASDSLIKQTDSLHIWVNRWKDAFGQIMIYAKAWGRSIVDILNFDFKKIPSEWAQAWKEATATGKNVIESFDIAKALNKGTASFKDLKDAVKTFDMSDLTKQQEQLVKSYDFLNERAIKYVQHLRDIGKVSLRSTSESIEKLAKDAGLVGIELEAVIAEFARLKEINEDTFTNIVEKWEKDADPVFLTRLVDGFNALGGAISDTDKAALIQIENQRRLRIEQLNILKETADQAIKSGKDTEKFWNDYYAKEQLILKGANEDRKILSANATAQRVIAYGNELNNLDKYLAEARELYKYDSELRGKEIAKLKAESQARIDAIVSGAADADPKEQTNKYKVALKQRESAHAQYIASIKALEANRSITEELAEERRLNARLNFYKISLSKAKEFRDQVDKQTDPDEYLKRQKVVLIAEKKFYEEKGNYVQRYSDLKEKLEIVKAEKSATISESIYESALDKQANAQKTLNVELKAAYDTDILNIEEYYAKKRDLAFKDEKEQSELIENRIKTITEEFDKRIEAENSIIEKEELRGEKIETLSDLQSELDEIEQKRIQTVSKLTAQEYKDTEAAKDRSDKIFEQIKRRQEDAAADKPGVTLEEEFQLEMDALLRFQADKYAALKKETDDEVLLAEAKALQLKEIADRTAAYEKELSDLKLASQVQFAGDMASIAKDLIDSGLLKSKEAFKAYKAFAVAESTISTYSAATKAYDAAMEIGGPMASVFAWTAAAAAIVKGMAMVAKISAQQPPGYAEGGKIKGHSPHSKSDNIDIKATAGEYMQPVKAVKHYGMGVMNAIRNLSIPKEALANLLSGSVFNLSSPRPSFALADGGLVPSMQTNKNSSLSVDMTNTFTGVDGTVSREMGQDFEERVTKILYKVMR